MKHLTSFIMTAVCCLLLSGATAQQPVYPINGTITDSLTGKTISGASVRLRGSPTSLLSDTAGHFALHSPQKQAVLIISHIGYTDREKAVTLPLSRALTIALVPGTFELEEVVVSTGYESLPKERATGSFEKVSERLFNRAVTTNVLSRLDGITTGTFFDRRSQSMDAREPERLAIRGISTIRGESAPLIILDNFPYEGDPNNINPNDVQDITILRDAAAASIWGARAGNGVIVITSKKGNYGRPNGIRFNSAITLAEKPDLMSLNPISSSDFIDVEQFLFDQGYYNAIINSRFQLPLSPVTDLLLQVRNGNTDSLSAQRQIDRWRQNDVRHDFLQHTYRQALNQQYALSISGGSANYAYTLSGGYDRNLEPLISNHLNRTTLRTHHQLKITKRLEVEGSLRYSGGESTRPMGDATVGYDIVNVRGRTLYPYASLIDDAGQHAALPKDYRLSYTDTAGGGLLLDWGYRPLDEVKNTQINRHQEIRADFSASYRIADFLTARFNYMHQLDAGENQAHYPESSYYARNLVNQYTRIQDGQAIRVLPMGGILRQAHSRANAYGLRGQLMANHRWQDKHQVVALIGMEGREHRTWNNQHAPRYGYDDQTLTYSHNIDFNTRHPIYDGLKSNTAISNSGSSSERSNRFVSIYGNASYTYNDRYVLTGSFRRDASNIFGVQQNEKWSPLWSTGLSWLLSSEPWYQWRHLPELKLRASYGYSGNIDPSVAAQTILSHYASSAATGMPYAAAWTGPNPNLRWEKVRTVNFGVDLASRENRISGSLEYYLKHTLDLMSASPLDPTIGFGSTAIRNVAKTSGKGVDIRLNTRNLVGPFQWNSHYLFSYHKTVVTDYFLAYASPSIYISQGFGVNPIENQVVSPIFSYAWQGLDPATGDPIGLFNGAPSQDYYNITNNSTLEELTLHGSATPLYFGGFRNDFQYRNFSLSVNLSWFFDYYFRRPSLGYYVLYESWEGHAEFANRWQQPGDEKQTNVPSMRYPADYSRDAFYQNATVNVVRGDHIRLQDIRISYMVPRMSFGARRPAGLEIYAYANNLGIIWRRNSEKLDPQTLGGVTPPTSFSLGFTLDL